jgi:hypothetical protein
MRFAYIPKGDYRIGQVLEVQGMPMRVESYSHTGRNVVVHSLQDAAKFERIVCIATDAEPIIGIPAPTSTEGDQP